MNNICEDIFSSIENMLADAQTLGNGPDGSGEFSHGDGFE